MAINKPIVKVFNSSPFNIPKRQTKGSSGFDLCANLKAPLVLKPNVVEIIPTGIYVEIPEGFEGQVRSRSGLSSKYGVILVNGIGTIDSDYRGEIKIILMNVSKQNCTIDPGERIAQLIFIPIAIPEIKIVKSLSNLTETERQDQGFGHTGM